MWWVIVSTLLGPDVSGSEPLPPRSHEQLINTCADWQKTPADALIAACTGVIAGDRGPTRDLAWAYDNRGLAYASKGQYDRAIQDYNVAISLNPFDANAYNNRGDAFHRKRQLELAIEDYDRAIKIDPKLARAFNNRGNAYFDEGRTERAIEDYDEAVELDANYAIAFNNRGFAYLDLGQTDRAINDFDRAIAIVPGLALAFKNRGIAYSNCGSFDRAKQDFDRAIALDPEDADSLVWRGIAQLLAGHSSDAAADFGEVVRRDPSNAYGLLWLLLSRRPPASDDLERLKLHVARLDDDQWPVPVLEYYLGQRSLDEVDAAASRNDATPTATKTCEAAFYVGELELMHGRNRTAIPLLHHALVSCPRHSPEHLTAAAELRRLGD